MNEETQQTAQAIADRVGRDAAEWSLKTCSESGISRSRVQGSHIAGVIAYINDIGVVRDLYFASIRRAYEYLVELTAPKLETLSPLFSADNGDTKRLSPQ